MTVVLNAGDRQARSGTFSDVETLAQSTATTRQSISVATPLTQIAGGTATGFGVNLYTVASYATGGAGPVEGMEKYIVCLATGEVKVVFNGQATGFQGVFEIGTTTNTAPQSVATVVAATGAYTLSKPEHFIWAKMVNQQWRIIAGLALGTVLVEAAPKSGSLITARLAAEMGREVMAVPGSPLDPRAQGCNALIRDGATLIQTAADVLEQIRPIDARMLRAPVNLFAGSPPEDASDADRQAVTALLGPAPVPIDEVIRQSGRSPAIVQTILLELELAARLERHAGGRVSLI